MDNQQDDELIGTAHAARILHVSAPTVQRYADMGFIAGAYRDDPIGRGTRSHGTRRYPISAIRQAKAILDTTLTIHAAAKRKGCAHQTVTRAITQGQLNTVLIAGKRRIPISELENWDVARPSAAAGNGWITSTQVARLLGVSRQRVHQLAARNMALWRKRVAGGWLYWQPQIEFFAMRRAQQRMQEAGANTAGDSQVD